MTDLGRPLRGNLLSRLRRQAAARLAPSGFNQAQEVLDGLHGSSADLGFFHMDDGSKVYTCSVRLLSGSLAYGSGSTLAIAIERARNNPPIRKQEAA